MDGLSQGHAGLEFDQSMVPDGPPILPGSLSGTGWNHQYHMGGSGTLVAPCFATLVLALPLPNPRLH